jgi:hypothetical protein
MAGSLSAGLSTSNTPLIFDGLTSEAPAPWSATRSPPITALESMADGTDRIPEQRLPGRRNVRPESRRRPGSIGAKYERNVLM